MTCLNTRKSLTRQLNGSKEGIEVPLKIIKSAIKCLNDSGKMLFVTSSLSNYEKLIEEANRS